MYPRKIKCTIHREQKAGKETRDPVWSPLTKFQRKLAPRSIATCSRNMGATPP
jgi:hypothetical protein